jgi:hypothetical protein
MDANISDVVVVLDKAFEERLSDAVKMLEAAGLIISNAYDDHSVVEGLIDSTRLHELEKLECVDYVRRVFSYDANYPPGDPRDRDGV